MSGNGLSEKGTLRWSVGKRIAGLVCDADVAFDRLEREVSRLCHASLWAWFAERCRVLEAELIELGGFDEGMAEQLEYGGLFGRVEDIERFERTDTLMFELESLAGAFFVTLQPRLNAIRVAAKAVYQAAASEDRLPVTVPKQLALPTDFESAWGVANFVKHNDEWGTKLEPRQQETFAVLCRLDVASEEGGERRLARWPLIMGACALSGETELPAALGAIVTRCEAAGREIMAAVQTDFAPLASEIEAVRKANAPRLAIRSEPRPPRSEE